MCANSLPSHVIMQIIIKFLEENSISKIFSNLFRTKETQSRPASTRRQSAAIIFIYFSPTNVIASDANIFLIFSILNTSDFFSFFIGTICSAGCRCLVSGGCMNVCTFAPPYTYFFFVMLCKSELLNLIIFVYELDCVAYKVLYCRSVLHPLHPHDMKMK